MKNVEKSVILLSYPRYPHKNICFWGTTQRYKQTNVLGRIHKNRFLSKETRKSIDF